MHANFALKPSSEKSSDKPKSCQQLEGYINSKPISYEQIYDIVGRRFHECLDRSSKQ